jgi:ABC-type antimicrobial peptide transport system permease subunit
MLTGFAVLGLGLAVLGIYGVIARTMTQRTGEFAIRLALGASVGNITRMVLGSGVRLALAGSVIGLLGAMALSRLLVAGFPAMQFNSGPVTALATAFLIAIALVACYLPARHASRISAVDALRSDE